MTAIESNYIASTTSRKERAYSRAKKAAETAGVLTIACAAQLVGADPAMIHGAVESMSSTSAESAKKERPKRVSKHGESRLRKVAKGVGAGVYGIYYFGEDGMALAANAAAVGLMEQSMSGSTARLAAAGATGLAVAGWNDIALHWNEKMLRSALSEKDPSSWIESDRPIVQQLGLISSNLSEIFTGENEPKKPEVEKSGRMIRTREKVSKIKEKFADRASILNTAIVGAPVGFNDELMRKKLDIRKMKRRKIEALIAKHSAVFGATWGTLAASRGLDQVNTALEIALTPENLAIALTYIYGNKITRELFSPNTNGVEEDQMPQPVSFEDQITESLLCDEAGSLHPIHTKTVDG